MFSHLLTILQIDLIAAVDAFSAWGDTLLGAAALVTAITGLLKSYKTERNTKELRHLLNAARSCRGAPDTGCPLVDILMGPDAGGIDFTDAGTKGGAKEAREDSARKDSRTGAGDGK